jgi:hypothetical protein
MYVGAGSAIVVGDAVEMKGGKVQVHLKRQGQWCHLAGHSH